jgi:hypothetical protein
MKRILKETLLFALAAGLIHIIITLLLALIGI